LTGILDSFFNTNLIPIIETNRGCPYSCIFCAQGLVSAHIVKKHPFNQVIEEIEYISDNIKNTNVLVFADANFGLFERDTQIAEKISKMKKRKDYPHNINANWVKTKKSIDVVEKLGESTFLIASLQSMDPIVLKEIKRKNIPIDDFKEIMDYINEKGGISGTEIILGLPNETKESHINSIKNYLKWMLDILFVITC